GAPEIVQDATRHAGRLARLLPCLPEALERPTALRAMEHPQDHAADFLLRRLRDGALRLERRPKLRRHHERPALLILRGPGIEPDDPGLEIHVAPLQGEHFAPDAPTGNE